MRRLLSLPRLIHPVLPILIALAPGLVWATAPGPGELLLYSVRIAGHGPPVLLIPGLSNPGEVWQPVVDRWSADYTCHVVTLTGFGAGAAPEGPFLPMVREQLAHYAAGLSSPPVVVGHSLGATMALWIGATAPEAVAAIVAVDGVPFLTALARPEVTEAEARASAESLYAMMAAMDRGTFRAQNRGALTAMVTDPEEFERVARLSAGSDPETVARAMAELLSTDLRDEMGRLQAPVLMLAAGISPLGSAEAVAEAYGAQLAAAPRSRVEVIAGARHFLMLDRPEVFDALVLPFLAAHSGSTR